MDTTRLAELVLHQHPECNVNTCSISAAMRLGYVLVAAEDLINAHSGSLPEIERERDRLSNVGVVWFEEELEMQRHAFWAAAKAKTCSHCRSALYAPGPCASCGAKEAL